MSAVPASALAAMPIFPLPGVVLFPGAILPLHVFEPRYRRMLADCLAAERFIAMVSLFAEPGTAERPPFAAIAGAGFVVRHSAMVDGRSNIVLQGRARVIVEELPFVAPYRRARMRILEDVETPVSAVDRTALYAAATAVAAAAKLTDFELPSGIGPGAAADLCAHQLLADPDTRQRILEELDVRERVHLVTAELAGQIGRVQLEGREGRPANAKPD
jgi:Lon protease-like protein